MISTSWVGLRDAVRHMTSNVRTLFDRHMTRLD